MQVSNASRVDRLRRYLSQIIDSIHEFERISEPTALRISQQDVPASFQINHMPEFDGARHEYMMEIRTGIIKFLNTEKKKVEEAISKL